mgnify:CR=1 FL=1
MMTIDMKKNVPQDFLLNVDLQITLNSSKVNQIRSINKPNKHHLIQTHESIDHIRSRRTSLRLLITPTIVQTLSHGTLVDG